MRHAPFTAVLAFTLFASSTAWGQDDLAPPTGPTPEDTYEEGPITEAAEGTDEGAEDIDMDSLAQLSRLDISGYVQPELRYEHTADEDLLYFQLRRGRLKVQYDLDPALFLLQIDATQDGVGLKDAYGALTLPAPEGMEMAVLAGLFQIPFGFDLQYSSSRRVFPERSQMVRRLFPGERDLGVRLDTSLADELVEIQLAVQNGVPLGDENFGAFAEADGDDYKDATLRVAVSPLEPLTVGVSGLYGVGTHLIPDDPATPAVDESDEFDFPRWAVGAELRYTRALGSLGDIELYGEVAFARNLARKSSAEYPMNGDAEIDVLTWYAAVIQSLGELFAVGARFDQFAFQDGDTENLLSVVGMALPADGTRLVLAWDFDLDETANHEGWLRMQVKF